MTYNVTRFDNGFRVVTYKIPHIQSVAINVIVAVGSRYESASESGISHFLEHMAFKGTSDRTAKQIAEDFDAIGGQFNAYTSKEHTVYYAKVLSEHTETSLEIIADILQNSVFREADIAKEYQVICQEIAQTYDSPDDLAYEKLYGAAFGDHPLGRSILGSQETISQFNSQSLKQYTGEHHWAQNIILSVAGDAEHHHIVKLAEKLFTLSRMPHERSYTAAQYIGGCSLIGKQLEQSTVVLGFESSSYKNLPIFYQTQLLGLILGGGISSRIFQKVREELGLAYAAGAYNSGYADTGIFSIYAGTSHENVNKVIDVIAGEILMICNHISIEELDRAKAQIKANILMAEEKSAYKSEEIGKSMIIFDRYDGPEEVLDIVRNTTEADLLQIATKIFSSKLTLSVVSQDVSDVSYERTCKLLS